MKFSLSIFSSMNIGNRNEDIIDILSPLHNSLSALGYESIINYDGIAEGFTNIIFGLQNIVDFPLDTLPENSIIYNFEQLSESGKGLRPHYIKALQNIDVWENNFKNIDLLKKDFGITKIQYIPFGFSPEMNRISPEYPKDIDVLFCGKPNQRQNKIVEDLKNEGFCTCVIPNIAGRERDFLLARSKVVLFTHYSTPGSFGSGLLAYYLSNHKAVVCERNKNEEVPQQFQDTCLFAEYEQLVKEIKELLANEERRLRLEKEGFEKFSSNPLIKSLQKALGNETVDVKPCVPRKLNAGSGRDYRFDFLNVDISEKWNPDILLNISDKLDFSTPVVSKRFGPILLEKGYFKEIFAGDILEHVPDLVQTMTNFRDLLCDGGILRIHVPFDLSCGAWQDPTHIRAFNKSSWRYYTDWAWLIGWRDARFDLIDLQYDLTPLGTTLLQRSTPTEVLLGTPRAVEAMEAVLRKRESTPEEKLEYDKEHGAFYHQQTFTLTRADS